MSSHIQGIDGSTDEDRKREQRHHKEMMRLTWVSIVVAVIIAIPVIYLGSQTGMVLDEIKEINIRQTEIENFESKFAINEPRIILHDPYKLPQFEYAEPLELSTMTSHNYRYTISIVKDSVELTNDGNCLFTDSLEILSVYPITFFLSSNGDETIIEPRFLLSPFPKYTVQENTIRTPVAEAQFEIMAEDLQDPSNNRILYTDVSFIINVPQKINLTELCS